MKSFINSVDKPRIGLDVPCAPVIHSRMFLEVLAEYEVPPSRLLEGTGLSLADLADPAKMLTINQQIQIYANAAGIAECPTVGLRSGQLAKLHHHGVLGYAMQTAVNLGQAIRIFNQYFEVGGPISRQILQIDGNVARVLTVDLIAAEPARRVGIEEMLGGNLTLFKQLTGGKFKIQELRLDYPEPDGYEAYEELFQCPVLFEQDTIEMSFDASLLNLKMKIADPEAKRVCEERCQELLDRLEPSEDIVYKVRKILYESPCDRRDGDSVAAALCISPRGLRRRLQLANTSFRKVVNEVQEALAVDYLRHTSLSIDEIAFLLGYSETSNFRHAFKQWTGQTPTSYRNQSA